MQITTEQTTPHLPLQLRRPRTQRARSQGRNSVTVLLRVLCVFVVKFVFYDCPDLAWTGSSGTK
jgi:hypothetical protein